MEEDQPPASWGNKSGEKLLLKEEKLANRTEGGKTVELFPRALKPRNPWNPDTIIGTRIRVRTRWGKFVTFSHSKPKADNNKLPNSHKIFL